MERDKINELFDYYFGEVIKESCDEVWDAQEDIIDFCEFVIGKLNISDVRSSKFSSKSVLKDKNVTPYSEWVKKLRDL